MKNLLHKIGQFLKKPKFMMFMGFAVMIAGLIEVFEITTMEFLGFHFEAEHMMVILGLNQLIIAFSHMVEGFENVEMVREEEELKKEEESMKRKLDERK